MNIVLTQRDHTMSRTNLVAQQFQPVLACPASKVDNLWHCPDYPKSKTDLGQIGPGYG